MSKNDILYLKEGFKREIYRQKYKIDFLI